MKRSTLLLGLVTSVLPLTLSGCFSGSDQSSNEDLNSSTDARVQVAMLQPPRSALSPLSDDAFKLSRWQTAETLINLNAAGDARPGLATAWKRRNPRTWEFTIRDGVSFHDGTKLTAGRAAASLTAAADGAPKPRILDGVELSVSTQGDSTLVVETAAPDPLVPQRLSSPQLSVLAANAYAERGVVDPVGAGTGPFVLTEVNGTTGARLDRYPDYWGSPARSAGIDVDFVPDGTARAAALRTGDADLVEAIPVAQAPLLEPELIHEVPMPRTNTLYLNTRTGPLADPRIRAAAAAAIERDPIVKNVYEGRADVAAGLLGPALPWAADLRTPKARPWATRVPEGTTITLGTFTDRAELPEVAVLLQQQLEAVGFTVTQDVREYAQIEADALAGDFDAFILSRATVLDSGDPVAYMYSDFACKGSFNIAQLCDKDVDRALDIAAAAKPGAKRRAAIMAAEKVILDTHAAVPMLHERVIQGEAAHLSDAARDSRERLLITADTRVRAKK